MSDYPKNTIRHIMGNLGTDPEKPIGADGKELGFTTFRIAVTRDYDDDAKPRWYSVTVSKDALQDAVMSQLKKGSRVGVEGVPSTKEGANGQTFYNFRAFRIGLVEYLAVGAPSAATSKPAPAADEDDDWD